MRFFIILLCLGCLIGCSTMRQTTDASIPQILIQYPLPIVPESISRTYFGLDIILFVLNDGSVENVRFIKGSGDDSWDSLAIETIKRWRFTPARIDNQPISTWTRLRTTVKYANPQYISLAEILCTTVEEADSGTRSAKERAGFW